MFGYRKPRKTILGVEVAGEIEAVGKDVTDSRKAMQVFGIDGTGLGAYAEYVCMSEAGGLVLKPANLTYEEAAAIPIGAYGRSDLPDETWPRSSRGKKS